MRDAPSSSRLPDEPSVYPYTAATQLPGRALLVLAPHADDEVFGCGGALARSVSVGTRVHVVVVSDGAAGGSMPLREQECRQAMRCWAGNGSADISFWRLPDRGLVADDVLLDRIAAAGLAFAADHLLAPSPWEVHPDHRIVSIAATAAAARLDLPLAYYEVGHPLLPNLLVDITPSLQCKAQAMRAFASQLDRQRYDEQVLALNRYRAYTLGPAVSHAEAFCLVDAVTARQGVAAVIEAQARAVLARLGMMSASTSASLP